jgi:hypothetical protein
VRADGGGGFGCGPVHGFGESLCVWRTRRVVSEFQVGREHLRSKSAIYRR